MFYSKFHSSIIVEYNESVEKSNFILNALLLKK
uniref:Uncharacterized protein n=1 Tax=Siphoviridae sp. ctHip2 TaxID=2827830 RepID=A0A8S5RVU1_9CAUD|nr:MAG TPA: hypothetical protein [Siphoviridae sp. ctHip2]